MQNNIIHSETVSNSLRLLKALEQEKDKVIPLLVEHDLTFNEWLILSTIGEYNEISPGELTLKIVGDSGSTSNYLRKLEKRGLIKRTFSTLDRRRVKVELTETSLIILSANE